MQSVLNVKDLQAVLLGGCFFGSGGGGTVESAQSLVAHFKKGSYYPTDHVNVVTVDEVHQGDTVMVAYLGSPAAIDGANFPIGPVAATQAIQERLQSQGRELKYVIPPESGALGFTVACLVAAKLGLAVIDADGAGRAVPSLPQLTYAAFCVDPRPTFLVSQKELCVELNVSTRDAKKPDIKQQQDVSSIIDQMLRPIVAEPDFDEFGGLAMWIMTPEVLKVASPIQGTLTRALEMGREFIAGNLQTADKVMAYLEKKCDLLTVKLFPTGKFITSEIDTTGGFDLGKVQIQAQDETCMVLYQNESLLAWSSRKTTPICMAPDSIAYLVEGEGQNVFSNGDLVNADGSLKTALKHRKVVLLGIKANKHLVRPDGLILTSFMEMVEAIGYRGPYIPLEHHQKEV